MTGNDGSRVLTTNGERGAGQVAEAVFQLILVSTVVDWQFHRNLRNGEHCHSVAWGVENVMVFLIVVAVEASWLIGEWVDDGADSSWVFEKPFVVVARSLEKGVFLGFGIVSGDLLIAGCDGFILRIVMVFAADVHGRDGNSGADEQHGDGDHDAIHYHPGVCTFRLSNRLFAGFLVFLALNHQRVGEAWLCHRFSPILVSLWRINYSPLLKIL